MAPTRHGGGGWHGASGAISCPRVRRSPHRQRLAEARREHGRGRAARSPGSSSARPGAAPAPIVPARRARRPGRGRGGGFVRTRSDDAALPKRASARARVRRAATARRTPIPAFQIAVGAGRKAPPAAEEMAAASDVEQQPCGGSSATDGA